MACDGRLNSNWLNKKSNLITSITAREVRHGWIQSTDRIISTFPIRQLSFPEEPTFTSLVVMRWSAAVGSPSSCPSISVPEKTKSHAVPR